MIGHRVREATPSTPARNAVPGAAAAASATPPSAVNFNNFSPSPNNRANVAQGESPLAVHGLSRSFGEGDETDDGLSQLLVVVLALDVNCNHDKPTKGIRVSGTLALPQDVLPRAGLDAT